MSDDGATVTDSFPLRRGDRVDLTDESLFVAREETVRVRLVDVEEITIQSFDWFLGIMSIALVGFGALTLERSALAGATFAVLGVLSLYWTYHERNTVTVTVRNRAKPLTFRPADVEAFHASMADALAELSA